MDKLNIRFNQIVERRCGKTRVTVYHNQKKTIKHLIVKQPRAINTGWMPQRRLNRSQVAGLVADMTARLIAAL